MQITEAPSVLLVNPVSLRQTGSISPDYEAKVEGGIYISPLSLLYVGYSLEQIGCNVEYFDLAEHCAEDLSDKDYLFVGITMLSGNMIKNALKIARIIKKRNKNMPIVVGGVHPTVLPEETLKSSLIDFVVVGEGEETVKELATSLIYGNGFDNIKGIGYKKNGHIIINEKRPFIDVNTLPMELPFGKTHLGDNKKIKKLPLHTSRGCSYRCSFCCSLSINKKRYRQQKPERIVQQLEQMISTYPELKAINFQNEDEFFINQKRVFKVLNLMEEKEIKINWNAFIRFDTLSKMDDAFLKLIRNSPITPEQGVKLSFGGESASQRILDDVIHKDITVDQIRTGSKRLSEAKILHNISFICGLPSETREDLRKSTDLIVELYRNSNYVLVNGIWFFTPIPGTTLYEKVVGENKFVPPDSLEQWADYDIPLGRDHLSKMRWNDRNHLEFAYDLYIWSTFQPFQYLKSYTGWLENRWKGPRPHSLVNLVKYLFLSTIVRIRYRFSFYKFPIEYNLVDKTIQAARKIKNLITPKK